MDKKDTAVRVGKAIARGVVEERTGFIRERVERGSDRFKREAAERVEGLADEIRRLGQDHGRPGEAHSLARRLERAADYLRYRPIPDVAADALDAARRYKLFWIAGGMLASAIVYRIVRHRAEQ